VFGVLGWALLKARTGRRMVPGLVLAVLWLAGCGSPAASGYFTEAYWSANQAPAAVVFLQFITQGSSLSGTLDETYFTDDSDSKTASIHLTLTGTEQGGQVTLTLSGGGLFGTGTLSGTTDGSDLSLEIPEADGTLQTYTFTPSTVTAYNKAVQGLQADVASAQASQAAASAQASAAAQQAQLDNAVYSANNQVEGDLTSLANLGPIDTSVFTTDLKTQQNDLAAMRQDEASTRNDQGGSSAQCSDADGVQSDADGIQSDADGVQSDADGIQGAIGQVKVAISTLNNDFAALQAAEQNDPGYSGPVVTQDQVNSAAAAGQKVIATATQAADQAVQQAQSVATSAANEAAAFVKQYCG
jgi:hypothetical protein